MQKIVVLIGAMMLTTMIWGQPGDSTYTIPGSHIYTIPAGYTATLEILAWGGGGSGGRQTGGGKGGGGGGAFAMSTLVLGSGMYTVTVGAGGTAGLDGVSSNFNDAVIAVGGASTKDATGGLGGAAADCTGDVTYSGGNGGNGIQDGGGGGGGEAAGPEGNGDPGSNQYIGFGGDGGAGLTSGGDGGNGGYRLDVTNAEDGMAPGGGGGGKHGPLNSNYIGIGGDGMVVVHVIDYALPIALLSFEGNLRNQFIDLTWSTATEINNDYMAVERSFDGIHFVEIGRVNGNGTSQSIHHYAFTDVGPQAGTNYYRLRQVDIDGVASVHKIITVEKDRLATGARVSLYPNPSVDRIFLQWDSKPATSYIRVFDLMGRMLEQYEVANGIGTYDLSVSHLASGSYILELTQADASEVLRFTKN